MEEDIKDKQVDELSELEKENKRLKARIRLLESQLHSPDDIGDFIYQEYIR